MPNTLAKSLHLCFRPQHHHITTSSKHNSHNHLCHRHLPLLPQNTTYTKTYNSLYEDILCCPLITTTASAPASPSTVSDTDTDMAEAIDDDPVTPDLTAAYASCRFFISSPGLSNSIVDSLPSSSTSLLDEEAEPPPAVVGGVAVETYSPDPYVDFRRSMEEMVAAREVAGGDVGGSWQYLQELLLSYLSLNPKSTHKYIVRAFGDVVVGSMSPINNNNNNVATTSSSSSQSFSSYCGANCTDLNNDSYLEI